jgi:hypothetical protein
MMPVTPPPTVSNMAKPGRGTLQNPELLNLRMACAVTSPGLPILEIGLLRRKKKFSEAFRLHFRLTTSKDHGYSILVLKASDRAKGKWMQFMLVVGEIIQL